MMKKMKEIRPPAAIPPNDISHKSCLFLTSESSCVTEPKVPICALGMKKDPFNFTFFKYAIILCPAS